MPLRSEFFVRQDLLDEVATRCGPHGVLAPDQMAQINDDGVAETLAALGQDVVEGTYALSVEPEVLGEALRNAHLHAGLLVEEVAHRPGVLLERPRCETLVGRVEEGEDLFALAEVGNGLPLLLVGIKAGGVMCAGVEEDDIALLRLGLQGRHHTVEVKGAGRGVVVRVGLAGDACEFPDGHVVGPGWVGEPDLSGLHVGCQEQGSEVVCAGACDGLDGTNAALVLLCCVLAIKPEHYVPSQLEEGNVAFDGGVLVSGKTVFGKQLLLGFAHAWKRPWLAVVGAVDANSQADLLRERIRGIRAIQGEDLIWWDGCQCTEHRHGGGKRTKL